MFLSLQDAGAGLLAAAMIAVVPGYISRSVAGSYDNEGNKNSVAAHFIHQSERAFSLVNYVIYSVNNESKAVALEDIHRKCKTV